MSDDQDKSQKTEEPTHRRLEEAFKRGQTVTSREVSNFIMLLAFTLILGTLVPYAGTETMELITGFLARPHDMPTDEGSLRLLLLDVFVKSMGILALITLALMVSAVGAHMLHRRIAVSWDPVKPKWEKLSIMKGFGKIFSQRNLMEFIKGMIKICIVGWIGFIAVKPYLGRMVQLSAYEPHELMRYLDSIAVKMLTGMCVAMAAIAILDYLYQRFDFFKNLRMSRQEIKDEFKEQEGDPHIKAKVRAIRQERAKKRMMAAVPTADVVITNPTHFAVALKYDNSYMRAPTVVAKGQDKVAEKIREVAKDKNVPIVSNPPLARALHTSVRVDDEVPAEHYKAVAEVIGYVYRLKGKIK